LDPARLFPLNEWKIRLYNAITQKGVLHKGMAEVKQVIWSMVVVLMAAFILAGTVIYTVSVLRTAQIRILTGEMAVVEQTDLCR